MNDISYIVVSKNDTYDVNNLDKLILTINTNVGQLIDLKLDMETILVDWCSDTPFYQIERFKKEIKVPLRYFYVDKSLVIADGLNPNRFYEFFAKNIGVRKAKNRYVLLENSDILNDEDLAKEIARMVNSGLTNVYGRPTVRVNVLWPDIDGYTHYDTIDDKPYGDLNPGDFMLTTKEDWIEKAQGYDEINPCHRQPNWQTHMDVEILVQMVLKGMSPHYLQGYYRHMDHERGNMTHQEKYGNSMRNVQGYTNRSNWGYIDADIKEENGVTVLYKKL